MSNPLNGHRWPYLTYDPNDDRDGPWTRKELEEMNARFTERLEEAFRLGLERRESAAGQVKLPVGLGPRWVTPLTREIQEGLWRSSAADTTRVRRPLGNRNTVAVQTTFDASFPACPNQFVFPFGPFLVGNLPLSPHRSHLDNLAASVEGALSLAVPCCRSGGSLPRGPHLSEEASENINHPLAG